MRTTIMLSRPLIRSVLAGCVLTPAAALLAPAGAQAATPPVQVQSGTVSMTGDGSSISLGFTGTGFGARPSGGISPAKLASGCGSVTGTDWPNAQLSVVDVRATAPWSAGSRNGTDHGDCIGIVLQQWSNTSIAFTFGSFYLAHSSDWVQDSDTLVVYIKGVAQFLPLSGFASIAK